MKVAVTRARLAVAAALLVAASGAVAQGSVARDPMRPPLAAGAIATAPATPATPTVRHLLIVDGRRYVVDGGRRRAVGELLGDARIERIEDSAVIVRRAGQLHRLALFAGVTKKASSDSAAAATAAHAPHAPALPASPAASRTVLAATAAAPTPSTRR